MKRHPRRHPRRPTASPQLRARIATDLRGVDDAAARLRGATVAQAPLPERRTAHADLRRAFAAADASLREATALTKGRSHGEWSRWRSLQSALSTARQIHLFTERDDPGALVLDSIRAIDYGMSGPAIGDLLHGQSRPPGTPAAYGLDMEAVLARTPALTAAGPS